MTVIMKMTATTATERTTAMQATRWGRRWWIAAAILLVVVAIGRLAAGHGKGATPPAAPAPPAVGIIRV